MSEIEVRGDTYDIKHIGRDRYTPSFVLVIQLANLNEINIPHQKLRRHLVSGRRSDVTDELIKKELADFAKTFPAAEIQSFGVTEEIPAREGRKTDDTPTN